MAEIQFFRGIQEDVIPKIHLTRSRPGPGGTANFFFNEPKIFDGRNIADEITQMYLLDEEGEIVVRDVKGGFINGRSQYIEAILTMKTPDEWERFMRFMQRFSEENGLDFTQAEYVNPS
jgi:photosystem II protein